MSGQLHTLATLPPVTIRLEAEWAPELVWMQWQREKTNLFTAWE